MYLICFADRITISVVAPMIQREFGFDKLTMGFIFSAFVFAYALGQIPGGWVGDRLGPRRVLPGIVAIWSLFTTLTAQAFSATSFIVVRLLFGFSEGGAYPTATRAMQLWYPKEERGFVQGITHGFSRFGGAIVPPVAIFIMNMWGWRAVFYVFGVLGIFWSVLFYAFYRNTPEEHKWVNKSSPVITNFGGPWGVYSVVATGFLGALCKDEKVVQTSLLATQAMITSGVWANIIKVLTGRERPLADYTFSNSEGGIWYGPFALWDEDLATRKPVSAFDAFPSGHTATAFSIATVFAMQYRDKKAIPIICYSAATLVGISRLTEHEHWSSDVFVGGLLGYLCGRQVVNHYNKTHRNKADSLSSISQYKTEFTFIQNGNQVGFSVKW